LTYLFFERALGLQRLGRVQKVTPSENLIVKADIAPKLGAEVVDENLKVVGKIFDIIGPVSSPYAVVKPSVSDPAKLANKQLYLLLSKGNRGQR
jgi:RNA-binding protein